MDIKIITDFKTLDILELSNFILQHSEGNFFQSIYALNFFNTAQNYEPVIVIALSGKEIVGSLLAAIIKEGKGIKSYLTRRCIVWGGPIIKDNDANITKRILNEFNLIVSKKCIYSEFRNFWIQSSDHQRIFASNGLSYEPHLNITIDLSIGESELWKNIKRQRKDGINKAKKQGFSFNVVNEINIVPVFYRLLQTSYKQIKLPYPQIDFFYNIVKNIPESNYHFFSLYKEDIPIAILCALSFKQTLYAFYLGSTKDKDLLKLRPIDYFYWEVIRWASKNNYRIFDWMGAGKPDEDYGVRKFKLEYGGELLSPGRYIKINQSFLYFVGKTALKLFQKLK